MPKTDKGADTASLAAFEAGKSNSVSITIQDPAKPSGTVTLTMTRP